MRGYQGAQRKIKQTIWEHRNYRFLGCSISHTRHTSYSHQNVHSVTACHLFRHPQSQHRPNTEHPQSSMAPTHAQRALQSVATHIASLKAACTHQEECSGLVELLEASTPVLQHWEQSTDSIHNDRLKAAGALG